MPVLRASQVALVVKNLLASAGEIRDISSIPGSRRSPGGRDGNPLQYSCLENPMDRGVRWVTVYKVAETNTTEAIQHTYMPLFIAPFLLNATLQDYINKAMDFVFCNAFEEVLKEQLSFILFSPYLLAILRIKPMSLTQFRLPFTNIL